MGPLELISCDEIRALKFEAYEFNDARLMAVAHALENVQGDPYATCTVLLTAFRMLTKDHRGLMEKLVKTLQNMPRSPIIIINEDPTKDPAKEPT